jgi:hypothetical protein
MGIQNFGKNGGNVSKIDQTSNSRGSGQSEGEQQHNHGKQEFAP